jgi:DNA-binding transcriptional regulator PaaX
MRGEATLKLLEIVNKTVGPVMDIGEAFLRAGYGASRSRMEFEHRKLNRKREENARHIREKRNGLKLLYKLKREGLITERIVDDGRSLALTATGRKKLNELKNGQSNKLPANQYQKIAGDTLIVVVFDIPEKERHKRDWLRSVLARLGLKMIQQSVWIGKTKIPQDFLDDLMQLKMTDYVEILGVNKSGSLKYLL